MRNNRKDKLYNYMVNKFDLSKERILEYVDLRVTDLVNKHIQSKLNSNRVEKMIVDAITFFAKEGFNKSNTFYISEKISFQTFVKNTIKDILKERLEDEYQIEVKKIKKE